MQTDKGGLWDCADTWIRVCGLIIVVVGESGKDSTASMGIIR